MRGSATAILVGARTFLDAVAFTMLAAIAHVATTGIAPLPILPWALVLLGVGLVLATIQRERGSERQGATLIVVTLAAGVVWGLSLPSRDPDALAVLSRMVAFALIAEAFLWRNLSIARGAFRWSDARNGFTFAAVCLALVALLPGPLDRAPLALLALLVVALSGLALSLARTTEELALARGTRGAARASSAAGVSVVVGVVAVLAAAFVPPVQDALSAFGAAIEPTATRILYLILLPLGYMAAFVVAILEPFLRTFWTRTFQPVDPRPRVDEEALLREIERNRPIVFGAVELIVVFVALLVAVVIFDRMMRERRLQLPAGVTLERGAVEGFGLRESLRVLAPRRGSGRRAPRDDGSPAAALRLLYWRFLSLAERAGAGWRSPHETPAEHLARIAGADARWSAGAPIVRAFEDLRYGESPPDPAALDRSRAALRALEAARRAS